MNRTIYKKISIIAFLLLIILSADTFAQKGKKKKVTLLKKTYHNVTAKYNGYFNARIKINDAFIKIDKNIKDDYSKPLPVFKWTDESSGKMSASAAEESIKKSSIVIQRHEISKWVDNCYLLIGKANFLKRDYFTAIQSFQYITSNFSAGDAKPEALIWLIRSYIQLNKLTEAESIIDIAQKDAIVQKNFREEFNSTLADFYIKKQNLEKSIDFLNKSIASSGDKERISRYQYIIAQLYEKNNLMDKASTAFQLVIKSNPPYELSFNSKINSARLFQSNTKGSKKEIEKQLNQLLEDEKNKEFRDQIYFALGSIEEREKKYDQAIGYFIKSTSASVGNSNQKAESFLHIAKIYYTIKEDFLRAQNYYDSTFTLLSKEHPEYEDVQTKKKSLNLLVKNITIIKYEDSLLSLGKLSDKEKERAVSNYIGKLMELERQKRLNDQLELGNENSFNQNQNNNSTWYFYNTAVASAGYSEFLKKFGKRTLEDNWRRSNKESIGEFSEDTEKSIELDFKDIEKLKKQLLANIPNTPEKIEASELKMVEAYFELGNIYKEKLNDIKQSIHQFEILINRFPENKYHLECLYNLYKEYLAIGNTSKSDYYKNILLTKYPSSLFANIISNPNYSRDLNSPKNNLNVYYESTYDTYKNGNYLETIQRSDSSQNLFPNNVLSSKFEFLSALSHGKLDGKEVLKVKLKAIIEKYPNESVSKQAAKTLEILGEKNIDTLKSINKNAPSEFYFILTSDGTQDFSNCRNEIGTFNNQNFSQKRLRCDAQFLNKSKQMIIVRKFDSLQDGLDYITKFEEEKDRIVVLEKEYDYFLISPENFISLIREQDDKKYIAIFYNDLYQQ